MNKEIIQSLYDIQELVKNDPEGSSSWFKHYEFVIENLINKKLSTYRSAYDERVEELQRMMVLLNKCEKKLKQK